MKNKKLTTYIVPINQLKLSKNNSEAVDLLKQHATAHFPECMIPTEIVFLALLPLTQNGKIDRNALLAMPVTIK